MNTKKVKIYFINDKPYTDADITYDIMTIEYEGNDEAQALSDFYARTKRLRNMVQFCRTSIIIALLFSFYWVLFSS